MKIRNILSMVTICILLISPFVLANGDHENEIEEGRTLIESKVSCDTLTDEQLELIGEYYMEQMHPGEEHESMDKMMGGEGSESLRSMHIQMGKSMYCGEGMMHGGMMMMGRGMMDYEGMMSNKDYSYKNYGGWTNMMGRNMWPFSVFGTGFGFIFMILFWGLVIWLIVWIITQLTKTKKAEKTESATEILKKRYAKGEISKKQFEDMKKELSK